MSEREESTGRNEALHVEPGAHLDEEYDPLLRSLGATPVRREPWLHVGTTDRRHGWKLHVSTIPTQAAELLRAVVPVLVQGNHPFKIAASRDVLRRLNEGALGDTQVGKFATIYPESDDQLRLLCVTLGSVLDGFDGPAVVTDARVGPVLYTRYGAFRPRTERNRLGLSYATITLPNGARITDEYRVPFAAPPGVAVPCPVRTRPRVAPSAGPHRSLVGPGLLLVDVLKAGAKGRTFLAVDLTNQEAVRKVVVKEGRKHCLSDDHGRDMRDRIRHQHEVLTSIRPLNIAPHPDRLFDVDGDSFLTIEFADGEDLEHFAGMAFRHREALERDNIVESLITLSINLERLHQAGIIHRDVTPSNTRWCRDTGTIRLLDFELAHVRDTEAPPFHLGTPGYMSPQQLSGAEPDPSDDVYGFACLALLLLTGFDSRYLLAQPQSRRASIGQALSGAPAPIVELLVAAIGPSRNGRPFLRELGEALNTCRENGDSTRDDRSHNAPAPVPPIYGAWPGRAHSITDSETLLNQIANGVLWSTEQDAKGLWLSPEASDHEGPVGGRLEKCRSAYRGVAGPVYLLSRLAKVGADVPGLADRVTRAVDWLLEHVPTSDDQMPGLHFGEAGVAVAIAEAVTAGLVPGSGWFDDYLVEALRGPLDWPDLTHGAAGQGLAALIVARDLDEPRWASFAAPAVRYLVEHQDADGGWTLPGTVEKMSGHAYTGFAHGAAGIVTFLSRYASSQDDAIARIAAERGAGWLEGHSRSIDDHSGLVWPVKAPRAESDAADYWRWWCHGNTGIALCFLCLFRDTGTERYAQLARLALQGLPQTAWGADLGHCHGLSGVAEVYLEAANVLDEDLWADASRRLTGTMLHLAAPGRGTLTWSVRAGRAASADLMVGSGGPAHALLRELRPKSFGPVLL